MEKNPPGGEAGRNRKETPPPGLLPVPHKAGQPCADRRDVGEQQDTQGQRDQVGDDRDGDALHRDARYPRRHEKVDSKRRRQHGDVVGHHKDYAEMDRVDAELEDPWAGAPVRG